jgi:hypothetical protein
MDLAVYGTAECTDLCEGKVAAGPCEFESIQGVVYRNSLCVHAFCLQIRMEIRFNHALGVWTSLRMGPKTLIWPPYVSPQ